MKRKGFTLIELIVVIAILACIAAIGFQAVTGNRAPQFGNPPPPVPTNK